MAINSYWFNNVKTNGVDDRVYNAASFAEYLNGIISSGVLATPSTNLQVVADKGFALRVKPGSGWIDGYKMVLDSDMSLTLNIAHATFPRHDRVVFALDHNNRLMNIYVKTGSAASNPTPPALANTETLKELSLARIYVPAGATSITQARITDERPTGFCGYISGLINQVDVSTLYDQFVESMQEFQQKTEVDFDAWFQSLQDTLVSNTLFVEKKAVVTTDTTNVSSIPIPTELQYGAALDVLHVFVNGFRLVEGEEYTKTGTTITFKNPIAKIGTVIEITNWKTVGTTNVQEVVDEVLTLQDDVSKINTYTYYTTGENDETKLNDFIESFFNGTGDFAGIATNQQGTIKVVGEIKITDSSVATAITSSAKAYICAAPSSSVTKKLTLDFSDCIVNVDLTATDADSIVRVYGANQKVDIKNLRIAGQVSNCNLDLVTTGSDVDNITIDVTNNTNNNVVGIKVNNNVVQVRNCKVKIANTKTNLVVPDVATQIIGIYQTIEETDTYIEPVFENCYVELTAVFPSLYDLYGFSGFGNFDNCTASIKNDGASVNGEAASGVTGFYTTGVMSNCYAYVKGCRTVKAFDRNGRYINCKSYCETTCSNGNPVYGFCVYGKLTGCRALAINSGTGSAYGFFNGDATQKMHMVNCIGKGYVNTSAGSTQVGAGFSANGDATTQTIIMIGCDCSLETRSGKKQTLPLRIGGGTTGAKYSLIGNTFFAAPQRHSGTGDNYNYIGNIIG